MNREKIDKIFEKFAEDNPTPQIELNYTSHYTLLVAVILSAQSTDKAVNKVTGQLFTIADTPQKILALGLEGLKEYIKTIGLYNSKGKNIIEMSKALIERYNSDVPHDFEKLCKLPGVGRKTANVILNTIWNEPVIAVDTHVFRVSNRIGFCNTKDTGQTEKELNNIIPEKWKKRAGHWLVLHGRYICVARKPKCTQCIIKNLCEYQNKSCE